MRLSWMGTTVKGKLSGEDVGNPDKYCWEAGPSIGAGFQPPRKGLEASFKSQGKINLT